MENELQNENLFQQIQNMNGFGVVPCEAPLDLDDPSRFVKMQITPAQKMQVSSFMQSIPIATSSGMVANAYTVSFPEGLPHTLTKLKQGGVGSMVSVDGKFAGSASFHQMTSQAAALGAFSAMSVATGQYFMAQINSELKMINQKMDKILEFLYGDKKAELQAEIRFVQFAYQNYASIMDHDTQRIATIGSLQEAKKVAMKDIEFYLGDLDKKADEEAKDFSMLEDVVKGAYQIRDSLDLSIQLYIMSSLLEMQFAQNMDGSFISYLEEEMTECIDKCDSRILASFSKLKNRVETYKSGVLQALEKVEKTPYLEKMGMLIDPLQSGKESDTRRTVRKMLRASEKESKYYVKQDGNIYVLKGA